jgi:hypothetical protein
MRPEIADRARASPKHTSPSQRLMRFEASSNVAYHRPQILTVAAAFFPLHLAERAGMGGSRRGQVQSHWYHAKRERLTFGV